MEIDQTPTEFREDDLNALSAETIVDWTDSEDDNPGSPLPTILVTDHPVSPTKECPSALFDDGSIEVECFKIIS